VVGQFLIWSNQMLFTKYHVKTCAFCTCMSRMCGRAHNVQP
jgi:hypothetical protein